MAQVHPARPVGITLIALLLAINGVVAIIQAFAFSSFIGAFLISLIFGVLLLYLAFAMWNLQPWAWITTLILEGINVIFALLAIIFTGALGAWISLIVAAVIIYYLQRPEIRRDFQQPVAR